MPSEPRDPDVLEDLDPDELYAAFEARGRVRRARRTARASAEREAGALLSTRAGRVLACAVGAVLVGTFVGLVALWPHGGAAAARPGGAPASLGATVVATAVVPCPGPQRQRCRRVVIRLRDGPDSGRRFPVTLGPERGTAELHGGDRVRVDRLPAPPPGVQLGPHAERYSFVDLDRRGALLWLAAALVVLAGVLARWRGLAALAGVAVSLVLVVKFLVPAILAGSPPILVALVGSLAVMFVTVGFTSGVGAQSLAAAVGISAALVLASLLAAGAVHFADLNGFSSDLANVLRQSDARVSLRGVVLAGMVIGALGVLTDMAVSQASAVMALRRANATLSARALYRGAFAVGRDHLSATVHTLVLAYAGAALPLLLVLQGAHASVADAVNTQDMAEPIVATLVGAIALVAAVPLTTGLAALLAVRVPPAALGDGHAGHHH